MLEKIREGSTGPVAKIILAIIALSFIFAGVGGYINSSPDTAVAEVNGEEIQLSTFEQAFQSERSRMEAQLGEAFAQLSSSPEYLSTFRESVLTRLVNDKLLEQKTQELGIRVSDTELRDTILNMNEFSVAGQFNNDRYQAILIQAGFTPEEFRAYMRNQLARQQFSSGLVNSEFALDSEATQFLSIQNETRNARYFEFETTSFVEAQTASEDEISEYYQANIDQFDTEEKVAVQYIEVKVEDFLSGIDVAEEAILAYYDENQTLYRTEEERRASHILIELGEDEEAAKAQAEGLLERLTNGEDFAELAKAESQDTFSGENGGDLDWFGRGVMDSSFEEAAFTLVNVGDLSEVVQSEFGFHIIKLTDLRAEAVQPIEEVRDEIIDSLKRDEAEVEFIDVQQRMAEVAFEVPDSLEEVAAIADVEIKTTAAFTRLLPPPPFDNATLLNQAFSEELIEEGVNSDAIELNSNHFVFMRIAEHEVERTKPMSEVSSDIEEQLVKEKGLNSALEWLEGLIIDLDAGTDISEQLTTKELEWTEVTEVGRYSGDLAGQLNTELFKIGSVDQARAVELGTAKVGLVQLVAINASDESVQAEVDSTKARMGQSAGQTSFSTFIDAVNKSAEITTSL